MSDLAALLAMTREAAAVALLVFLRVGAALALLPGFGERSVPARVRLVLAFAFTAIVAPPLAPELLPLATGAASPALWLTEPVTGLLIGISFRMTVMVLQMAGTIAAQSISLSQVFASAGTEPVTVIGEILVLAGIALAVTLGLHVELAHSLIDSYRDLPPGQPPAAGELLSWGTARVSGAFALAFALAMPFVIAALIFNAALGVINKAMPQLMVAMVGAPALTLGGLVLLAVVAPVILSVWIRHLGDTLARPF